MNGFVIQRADGLRYWNGFNWRSLHRAQLYTCKFAAIAHARKARLHPSEYNVVTLEDAKSKNKSLWDIQLPEPS